MSDVSARSRIFRAVVAVISLGLVCLGAWLAHLANPHTTISESEGRTFFGVMLSYIPLVLIAAHVQRRPQALEDAESARLARKDLSELGTQVYGLERDSQEMRDQLASPDGYAAAMRDLATRVDLIARMDTLDQNLTAFRTAIDGTSTRLKSIQPGIRRESRAQLYGVVVGVFGIVFSLMGVLWPGSPLIFFVLVAALGLTFDLLDAASSPWLDTFSDKEDLAWRSAILVPYALVLGALMGFAPGINVG